VFPGELRCICECYRRRQTTTDASDRYYTMFRRASNNKSSASAEIETVAKLLMHDALIKYTHICYILDIRSSQYLDVRVQVSSFTCAQHPNGNLK